MPTKINSAGNQQNYVPKGNGDASGEYADNATGSNKHFTSFQKLGKDEYKTDEYVDKFVEDLDKFLDDVDNKKSEDDLKIDDDLLDVITDEDIDEWLKDTEKENKGEDLLYTDPDAWMGEEFKNLDGKTEENTPSEPKNEPVEEDKPKDVPKVDTSQVKAYSKKIEKDTSKFNSEDSLGFFASFTDEYDENKLKELSEDELKALVIAKKNEMIDETKEDKKFVKKVKDINNDETKYSNSAHLWKDENNIPTNIDGMKESLDKKLNYLVNAQNKFTDVLYDVDGQVDKDIETKLNQVSTQLNKLFDIKDKVLKDWEKKLNDIKDIKETAKKILEPFLNPFNPYSQSAKDKALWFKTFEQVKKYYTSAVMKQIYDKIDPKDLDYIKDYTMSYSKINEPLRSIHYSGIYNTKDCINQIEGMTKAIDQSPLENDMWMQRGVGQIQMEDFTIDSNFLSKYSANSNIDELVGMTYKDQGFVSCGTHKGAGFNGKILLNIYAPKGTKALYVNPISHYSGGGENETIIQRGYTYRITKAYKDEIGKFYMDVEIVAGSDSDKYNHDQLVKQYQTYA